MVPHARRALTTLSLPALAVLVFVADVLTKRWAEASFVSPSHVVDGVLVLVATRNPNGAFSSFSWVPEVARQWLFVGVGSIAVYALARWYEKLSPARGRGLRVAVPLVLGGALGNLLDRLRHGAVTDFIDVYATWGGRPHHWPIFNVADAAIVAGVLLLLISSWAAPRARWSPS